VPSQEELDEEELVNSRGGSLLSFDDVPTPPQSSEVEPVRIVFGAPPPPQPAEPGSQLIHVGRPPDYEPDPPPQPVIPNREDGERMRYMDTDVADRYERAINDPELLNLRRDLALMETKIQELMMATGTGESRGTWAELQRQANEFQRVWNRNDVLRSQELLANILTMIATGNVRASAVYDLQQAIEIRRKLSETETKRLVALKQFITAENAMNLVSEVIEIVRKHVTDREQLRECVRDLRGLITSNPN
jgi:hypothetical protein